MKVYDATENTLACASGVVKTGRRGNFTGILLGFMNQSRQTEPALAILVP